MLRFCLRFGLACLALASPGYAGVITNTWVGGSGNWDAAANWSAGVPNNGGGNTHAVTIASGGNDSVVANTSFTVDSIVLGGASGSAGFGNDATSHALATTDNFTVASNGSMVLTAANLLNIGGSLSNAGYVQVYGQDTVLSVGGNLNNSSQLAVGYADGSGTRFPATLNVAGTLTNTGTTNLYSTSTLNVGALSNGGTLNNNYGGTINITGGGQGVTDIAAGSSIFQGGSFNVINNGVSTNALGNLSTIEGSLVLANGETTTTAGSLTNSGNLQVYNTGTVLSVGGNLNNSSQLAVGYADGSGTRFPATLNVAGTLTNTGTTNLYSTSTLNVGALSNSGTLNNTYGGTINITGGGQGVTDIGAGSSIFQGGSFNVINNGVSTNALGNLSTIEGSLVLANGETTTTVGSLTNSGNLQVYNTGTVLSVGGNLHNSSQLAVGYADGSGTRFPATLNVAGTLTNTGTTNLYSTSTLNVGALSNSGTLNNNYGGTINITGGGQGVTDIAAGSSIFQGGSFNVINNGVSTNALGNLSTIEGSLVLANGETTTTVGSLTNSGNLQVYNIGTLLSVEGNLNNSGQVTVGYADGSGPRFPAMLNVDGTLTNTGTVTVWNDSTAYIANLANEGSITVSGNACLGSAQNSGTMMFTASSSLSGAGCNPFTDGTLTEIINGESSFGVIHFLSDLYLDGQLNVQTGSSFTTTTGQSIAFLNFAPGTLHGAFSAILNPYFNGGTQLWKLSYDNVGGHVFLIASDSEAPEPATTTLAVAGLGLLLWRARKTAKKNGAQ